MKKTLLLCWLVISVVLVLFSGNNWISLFVNEQDACFWGPNSITQTVVCVVGAISLVFSIISFKKNKNKQKK